MTTSINRWAVQDAKARFSELVNVCLEEGPQIVTRHGEAAVVLLPMQDYLKLTRPALSLTEFLAAAPRVELDIPPRVDLGRDIQL